jgi:large subunit ribosomal protein L10
MQPRHTKDSGGSKELNHATEERVKYTFFDMSLWQCENQRLFVFADTANCLNLHNLAELKISNQLEDFMAISRDKKNELVAEMSELLSTAKTTVFAQYDGLTVADVQKLRALARESGVTIRVIKNRLVRVALEGVDTYKNIDHSSLTGQLLYAISADDEVAPAKVLDTFAKTNDALRVMGGFSGEGALMSADEVKALASLPSKAQLIGEVIAQLLSPVHDVTNALSGNLHALLDGVSAKATN